VGYDYVHVAVDDHSRLAYVEVISTAEGGENQHACAGFVRRATAWFAGYEVTIERIMTDNAMAYPAPPPVRGHADRARHRPQVHQAPLPVDQRESRTV
jgi:hypothetical protein